MQRSIFLATSFLFFFIVTCKSQVINAKDPQPTKESTVYKGVTDNACAVEVAFGSPGSGIDGPTYEKVIKIIDERKLKYTAKSIGREGETRLCLPLTELKGKKKTEFINQLKKIVKDGQFTSVSVR